MARPAVRPLRRAGSGGSFPLAPIAGERPAAVRRLRLDAHLLWRRADVVAGGALAVVRRLDGWQAIGVHPRRITYASILHAGRHRRHAWPYLVLSREAGSL